jgi:hypothetical protein
VDSLAHAGELTDAPLLPPIPADAPVPTAKSRSAVRSLLLGLLAGGALGVGMAALMNALNAKFVSDLFAGYDDNRWAWVFMVLALFGAIVVHELGHVVDGLSVGFRFILFIAGPLRVERAPDGTIKPGLNKDLMSAGGLAALYPQDQRDLVRRFAWIVAAGPLGSLVTSVVCVAIVAALDEPGLARSFAATLAGTSLAIAVATVTPMRTGYYLTDGARLLQLRRGGLPAARDAALLSMIGANSVGTPIESWERELIVAGAVPADGSIFELQGRSYAYLWAVARGRVHEARMQLQRAIAISQGLPAVTKASLASELAFIDAMHPERGAMSGDVGPASSAAPTATAGVPQHARLRTMAAIAALHGDDGAARAHIDAARTLLTSSKTATTSGGRWELDRLQEIEARMLR